MGIEGQLRIELDLDAAGVAGARIASERPVHAASVLRGKTAAEAQRMLPLLFSICGTAQACAAARALEQAGEVSVTPAIEHLRHRLVDIETLREHLWRVLLDWPGFLAEQPARQAMAELLPLQRDFAEALCPEGDAFAIGGPVFGGEHEALPALRERLLDLLARQVFGMPVAHWLALPNAAALRDWAARVQTPASRLLQWLMQQGWEASGGCESAALPHLVDGEIARAMHDYAYVERPQWHSRCCETTSLTRGDSALLRDLRQHLGNGLLTRLAAHLHEIAALALGLEADTDMPRQPAGADDMPPPGTGIGQVAAARGQLVHRVQLDRHGRVADYRILAPTEWNFHPQGVASRALSTLRGDAPGIETQARLLITAIDPCVGYQLRLTAGG